MRKQRIAILGKGTAGSQAAIYFSKYFSDKEIVWHFDPNKPAQSVGEGSTLSLPRNLSMNIGFSHRDLEKVDGTFKTGIYKKDWGTANEDFFHDFPPPVTAYHFNAVKLQQYIEKELSKKVTMAPEAADYLNVDADFVFNASGTPKSFEDFQISEYIPVNSAYITQCYWDGPRFNYSLNVAAKYGWVFGIPLQNRCSIGYMYNDKINTKEEIQEDLKEIFARYNLEPSNDTNSISFNNYYKKENYQIDGKLVHSGNASFFLEPLEATSLGSMDDIQRHAHDLWNDYITPDQANSRYLSRMSEVELIIMMHYAAGSTFKTDFWEFAQERGIKKIESLKDEPTLKNIYSLASDFVGKPDWFSSRGVGAELEYADWPVFSFVQNIQGLGISSIMNKIFL